MKKTKSLDKIKYAHVEKLSVEVWQKYVLEENEV